MQTISKLCLHLFFAVLHQLQVSVTRHARKLLGGTTACRGEQSVLFRADLQATRFSLFRSRCICVCILRHKKWIIARLATVPKGLLRVSIADMGSDVCVLATCCSPGTRRRPPPGARPGANNLCAHCDNLRVTKLMASFKTHFAQKVRPTNTQRTLLMAPAAVR